ncbi:hypothetical protein [Gymnodinialimonas sp. 57CJ19]|uniref:hypothetical protein n=1 Tax=Gymnodinialimonas sp. 57CJ19 TaxID=3138498 RepID=UPI0031346368
MPPALLSGDPGMVAEWRKEQADKTEQWPVCGTKRDFAAAAPIAASVWRHV